MKKTLYAFLCILALSGCDDYEGQDVLPTDRFDGPGVFSGKKGEFEVPLGKESTTSGREKLK
jgi:hypothetical protein